MVRYDTNAEWDDPFDEHRDNRKSPRFDIRMAASIAVRDVSSQQSLRGRGLVRNMSYTGIRLATKHHLYRGQEVTLAVSTKHCPDSVCLPRTFVGPAEVVRVEQGRGGCSEVALRFGEPFLQNMEFAVFVDSLQRTVEASHC
jgi:hypothetical protein